MHMGIRCLQNPPEGGSYPYPLNLLLEREAIVVTQSLICLQEATWGGARGYDEVGWEEERDKRSEIEDQTQAGW